MACKRCQGEVDALKDRIQSLEEKNDRLESFLMARNSPSAFGALADGQAYEKLNDRGDVESDKENVTLGDVYERFDYWHGGGMRPVETPDDA